MVKAVDGMVAEQDSIIVSFIICLFSFALSSVGYFWVIMTAEAAFISSAVMAVGAYYWIAHGLRIYNKFKLDDDPKHGWGNENSSGDITVSFFEKCSLAYPLIFNTTAVSQMKVKRQSHCLNS